MSLSESASISARAIPRFTRCGAKAAGGEPQIEPGEAARVFRRDRAVPSRHGGVRSTHYWARELTAMWREVVLMPPAYIKPYVKRGKNDAVDAAAICEAMARPNMRKGRTYDRSRPSRSKRQNRLPERGRPHMVPQVFEKSRFADKNGWAADVPDPQPRPALLRVDKWTSFA